MAGAIGSIATAAALFFVGWQAILTREQMYLRRAWLIRRVIEINFGRLVLLCQNYGELPAKVLCIRSKASYTAQLTESDLRATIGSKRGTVIFPDKEGEFIAEGVEGIRSHQDMKIRFGFIIEYEYLPGNIGEYVIIGEFHQSVSGITEIIRAKEWSKEYGLRNKIRASFSKMSKSKNSQGE